MCQTFTLLVPGTPMATSPLEYFKSYTVAKLHIQLLLVALQEQDARAWEDRAHL